jgi:hypothetical protein
VAPNDVHPNARGHALIARAILRAIPPETFLRTSGREGRTGS